MTNADVSEFDQGVMHCKSYGSPVADFCSKPGVGFDWADAAYRLRIQTCRQHRPLGGGGGTAGLRTLGWPGLCVAPRGDPEQSLSLLLSHLKFDLNGVE